MKLYRQVERLLEEQVRPMLRKHGGEARLVDCADGVVTVELLGACSGCPAADLSTTAMIEDTLRAALPEVRQVELCRTVSPDLLASARRILQEGGGI